MAIIIPSKNIYSIEDSSIIENQIRKTEINASDISIIAEENVSVHSTDTSDFFEVENYKDEDISTARNSIPHEEHVPGGGGITIIYSYNGNVSYAKYDNYKTSKKAVGFYRTTKNNKYISALNEYEESEDGISKSPVTYTIYGKITKGTAHATWNIDFSESDLAVEQGDIVYSDPTTTSQEVKIINIPNIITASYNEGELLEEKSSVELKFKEAERFIIISTTDNRFEIEIAEIPSAIRTTTLTGFAEQSYPILTWKSKIDLIGNYELYEPTRVEISILGNMLALDIKESNLVYGDSSSSSIFALSDNELLQVTNLYLEENALEKLSKSVFSQYQNGKETMTLRCSISDYYEKGEDEPIISIKDLLKPMMFRIGDIIEPYQINEFGLEVPISENIDNTPKQFKVVGIKPIFDGACWQELTCQENIK